MSDLSGQEECLLSLLGDRLRQHRIDMNEPQMEFARRVGVSVPTYRKMERGGASVPIGYWARVLRILDRLDQLGVILEPNDTPVEQWTNPRTRTARQRVRKRVAFLLLLISSSLVVLNNAFVSCENFLV